MSRENIDAFQDFIEAWQQNVDALRLFNDAFNGRDLAALLSSCDPDIEVASGRVLMGAPTYRGHSGMEQWLRDVAVAWEELRVEPNHLTAIGDDALVGVGASVGMGKTAGVPFVTHHMAVHLEFAHGKVRRCEFFASEREALEAAGLRE